MTTNMAIYPLKVPRCSPILQTTVPTHFPLWKAWENNKNRKKGTQIKGNGDDHDLISQGFETKTRLIPGTKVGARGIRSNDMWIWSRVRWVLDRPDSWQEVSDAHPHSLRTLSPIHQIQLSSFLLLLLHRLISLPFSVLLAGRVRRRLLRRVRNPAEFFGVLIGKRELNLNNACEILEPRMREDIDLLKLFKMSSILFIYLLKYQSELWIGIGDSSLSHRREYAGPKNRTDQPKSAELVENRQFSH